jgi:TonB family protein
MEIFIYLVKVNIAIILFYGFYALFFRNDTFFQWKRVLMLLVFSLCILYPFCDFSGQVVKNGALATAIEHIPALPVYHSNNEVSNVIVTGEPMSYSVWNHIPELMADIYCFVLICLSIRMVWQIFGVLFLLLNTETKVINGEKIYLKKGLKTPFSFFGYIVLDPEQYKTNELAEILRHEKTHVRQGHSVDMIITELMCIVCWFNPFVWLLKREARMNLEYLADRSVIDSGCDTEHYQFHLLRLSYHKAAAQITNNFNFSPLKKRIFMMNKKQSSSISIVKYALMIPVVAVLLLFNSCLKTDKQTQTAEQTVETTIVEPVADAAEPVAETIEPVAEAASKKPTVFDHVTEMPLFPGGEKAQRKWLEENIKFPEAAAKKGITGRVTIRFVISATGKVGDVEVLKSLNPEMDKEAVRAVKQMPDWIPGKQDGKPVSVYYNLPVLFKK